jgi:hypothetical protein
MLVRDHSFLLTIIFTPPELHFCGRHWLRVIGAYIVVAWNTRPRRRQVHRGRRSHCARRRAEQNFRHRMSRDSSRTAIKSDGRKRLNKIWHRKKKTLPTRLHYDCIERVKRHARVAFGSTLFGKKKMATLMAHRFGDNAQRTRRTTNTTTVISPPLPGVQKFICVAGLTNITVLDVTQRRVKFKFRSVPNRTCMPKVDF